MTVDDVAALLGVSVGTVYNWSYRRALPSIKVGGALRFKPEALDAYLAKRTRKVIQ